MSRESDVAFTFDETPFMRGLKKLTGGMKGFEDQAKVMAKGVTAGIMGAVRRVAALGAAFLGVRAVIRAMPEVGQAFGIAKDIVMRNLLFPLRREVMPLLQKMLDWVRDHRAMFARWGQMIAGVFRTAVLIVKTFLGLVGQIGKALFGNMDRFERSLNIFLFKVSLTAQYIADLLAPLIATLGKVAEFVKVLSGEFLKGLGSGLSGAIPAIKTIIKQIDRLVDAIVKLDEKTGIISKTFEALGRVLGETVMVALFAIQLTLEALIAGIERLPVAVMKLRAFVSGDKALKAEADAMAKDLNIAQAERFEALFEGMGKYFAGQGQEWAEWWKGLGQPRKVKDVIITRRGEVVETAPEDTITATRGAGGLGMRITVTNYFNVAVTEGDAEAAGAAFGAGVSRGLRERVMEDLSRVGA